MRQRLAQHSLNVNIADFFPEEAQGRCSEVLAMP